MTRFVDKSNVTSLPGSQTPVSGRAVGVSGVSQLFATEQYAAGDLVLYDRLANKFVNGSMMPTALSVLPELSWGAGARSAGGIGVKNGLNVNLAHGLTSTRFLQRTGGNVQEVYVCDNYETFTNDVRCWSYVCHSKSGRVYSVTATATGWNFTGISVYLTELTVTGALVRQHRLWSADDVTAGTAGNMSLLPLNLIVHDHHVFLIMQGYGSTYGSGVTCHVFDHDLQLLAFWQSGPSGLGPAVRLSDGASIQMQTPDGRAYRVSATESFQEIPTLGQHTGGNWSLNAFALNQPKVNARYTLRPKDQLHVSAYSGNVWGESNNITGADELYFGRDGGGYGIIHLGVDALWLMLFNADGTFDAQKSKMLSTALSTTYRAKWVSLKNGNIAYYYMGGAYPSTPTMVYGIINPNTGAVILPATLLDHQTQLNDDRLIPAIQAHPSGGFIIAGPTQPSIFVGSNTVKYHCFSENGLIVQQGELGWSSNNGGQSNGTHTHSTADKVWICWGKMLAYQNTTAAMGYFDENMVLHPALNNIGSKNHTGVGFFLRNNGDAVFLAWPYIYVVKEHDGRSYVTGGRLNKTLLATGPWESSSDYVGNAGAIYYNTHSDCAIMFASINEPANVDGVVSLDVDTMSYGSYFYYNNWTDASQGGMYNNMRQVTMYGGAFVMTAPGGIGTSNKYFSDTVLLYPGLLSWYGVAQTSQEPDGSFMVSTNGRCQVNASGKFTVTRANTPYGNTGVLMNGMINLTGLGVEQ